MEMCRSCLCTGTGMVQMDKTFIHSYNILTSLCINFTKNNPLYTCKSCFDGVIFCTEFRNRCIASDLYLKQILNQEETHLPVDGTETKLEYNYDSDNIDDTSSYYTEEKKKDDDNDDDDNKFLTEFKTEKLVIDSNSHCNDNKERDSEDVDDNKDLLVELKTKTIKKQKTKKDIQLQKRKSAKEKPDDSKLQCYICPDSFVDNNGLTEHLNNHKLCEHCYLCGEHLTNLPHLLSHRIEHMPIKQMRCHICSKKFLTAISLEFHYMRIHELAEKNTPIQCKKCTASFDNGKSLRRHNGEVHSGITYTCDICAFGFSNKKQLIFHMIKHGQSKRYECDLCDYTSKYSSGLKSHKVRKHTKGRVYCKTCSQVYMSQSLLDKHICKYALGAICPICGLRIKIRSNSSLKRHMMSHNNVCKYKCELCPAKFKSSANYKTHMDKHAGTPKNRCEYCQRSFYARNVLIKHLRTHTGEKPYVCSICNKGFTGNHNLKVHMKVHGIMNLITKKDTKEETNKN